jgi:hypothetical protein
MHSKYTSLMKESELRMTESLVIVNFELKYESNSSSAVFDFIDAEFIHIENSI